MNAISNIKHELRYDPLTGLFWWKNPGPKRRLGKPAGTVSDGYVRIHFNYKTYLAHRLAWAFMFSAWPKEVDHKNGIGTDNRWSNLRLATRSQNNANGKVPRHNNSGCCGVHWHPGAKKWRARIQVRQKQIHLGFFERKQDASIAYVIAAKKHFGEFARAR